MVPARARCSFRRLPERIRGAGTLYLWLREGRSTLRAVRALRLAGRDYEMLESCALFMPGKAAPQLRDFSRMSTLHSLDVLSRSGWILDQLAEGRFTNWFHPRAAACSSTSRRPPSVIRTPTCAPF
jgi:hypothetical protein